MNKSKITNNALPSRQVWEIRKRTNATDPAQTLLWLAKRKTGKNSNTIPV